MFALMRSLVACKWHFHSKEHIMHIHRIDDLSLLNVFSRLALDDLILTGQVCQRWNAFRTKTALTRRSLVVLLGGISSGYVLTTVFTIPHWWQLRDNQGGLLITDGPKVDARNVLRRNSISPVVAKFLSNLCPNVNSLTVAVDMRTTLDLDQITFMLKLEPWCSKMVTLKLEALDLTSAQLFKFKFNGMDTSQFDCETKLLDAVNGLGSLKQLELNVDCVLIRNARNRILDLPVLAQLDSFNLCTQDDADVIFESLTRYGMLNRIGLYSSTQSFLELISLPPRIASAFSHLQVEFHPSNSMYFDRLCAHFVNLTTLAILFDEICTMFADNALKLALRSFAQLKQLVHLVLKTEAEYLNPNRLFVRVAGDEHCPVLHSVKVLTLQLMRDRIASHHIMNSLNYHVIFPKLQIVQLFKSYARACSLCEPHSRTTEDYNQCIGQLIKPFFCCPDLLLVKTNIPLKDWSRQDFE